LLPQRKKNKFKVSGVKEGPAFRTTCQDEVADATW
jgi:hypothetical protein